MGLGAEGSLDDVGLQAGDQGGNEDNHRRTDGDAEGDQQRLHAVVQQEAQGDLPFGPQRIGRAHALSPRCRWDGLYARPHALAFGVADQHQIAGRQPLADLAERRAQHSQSHTDALDHTIAHP